MLATELLCETWFGWAESDTPCCVLKAVVLATELLRKTRFGANGQSQIHTQPCLEGSRVGEETLG